MTAHRAPIEHPAGTLGENNKHLLDSMTTAYAAALKLAEAGHDVLSVQTGWRQPVIYIQPSPLCQQFKHGVSVARLDKSSPIRSHIKIRATVFEGCQVQWRDVQ